MPLEGDVPLTAGLGLGALFEDTLPQALAPGLGLLGLDFVVEEEEDEEGKGILSVVRDIDPTRDGAGDPCLIIVINND